MARLLREAAALTKQPTLKSFLEKRAAAFVSNDYYASDVAWMELDASIEPTIGPYEVYEDEWFNFKAAFEAFITLADDAETAKLERFSGELQELENHLPIDPQFRNPKLGGSRRSASSTSCSRPATATTACRPRRSTCRTTSASSPRRARSACCSRTSSRRSSTRCWCRSRSSRAGAGRSARASRSTRSSRTS